MKAIVKNTVRWLIGFLPDKICQLFYPIFIKIIDADEIEKVVLSNFTDKLIHNYDKIINKIVLHRKAMYISKIVWGGTCFSVAVLNNILGLVIYSLYLGYIPIIQINEDNENNFSWEWYFKQPLEDNTNNITIKSYQKLYKTRVGYSPGWITLQSGVEYERWSFIYQTFVKPNLQTKKYIDSENSCIGDLSDVLGVLMRGTDYISLKPKGHPVQPEIYEVFQEVCSIKSFQYRAIYMATEDERFFDAFIEEFGKEIVLSNKRQYYDKQYIPGESIGEVHFDRDNDNYLKGLEYLSSLVLLSRCGGMIAGNCGGSNFAILYAKERYCICNIFDKEVYS